jgi:hypothetical protein
VTVVLHKTSCGAAASCRNKRFLSGDAPRLPLPECPNRSECRCTYKHFEDRRKGVRRTADMNGALSNEAPKTSRRQSRGRRSSDKH